jgi:hypothetical protein
MSIVSGPKIKRDNLILQIDTQNKRNFQLGIGENLFDGNYLNIRMSPMRELTFTFVNIEDGWYKYSISGTGTSNTYPYSFNIRPMTINSNFRTSVAFKYKTNVENKFSSWGDPRMVNIFYKDGFRDVEVNYGDYRYAELENVSPDRTTSNVPLIGDQTQPIYFLSRPIEGAVFNPATDFLYFKDIVVENNTYTGAKWFDLKNKAYNLEFFNSTRLNTEANGIALDGVNDYININGSYNIKTIILVTKFSTAGSYTIVGPHSNGHDNWFGISSGRKIEILGTESSDINNFLTYGNTVLETNRFYHLACTIDTNTIKAYVNGNLDGQSTQNFTIGPWSGGVTIGRRGTIGQRYFNGEITFLKFYDTVLTAEEIKQNFESFRGRYRI